MSVSVARALALTVLAASAAFTGAAAANGISLGFAGQGGVRYFLSDKVAVNGQFGFGYGTLGLGATWRF
ncbi:MAG TPA: hypothetical protein VHE78_16075 [Gemmatimonadaceae bacterium]|nr:hypothetical protein [Gemmatimonadaceae bacterium]